MAELKVSSKKLAWKMKQDMELSQVQMATLLGVSQPTIHRLLHGKGIKAGNKYIMAMLYILAEFNCRKRGEI